MHEEAGYSVRATPTATVSVPLSWDELTPRLRVDRWTIANFPARLKRVNDPWAGYFTKKQRLPL